MSVYNVLKQKSYILNKTRLAGVISFRGPILLPQPKVNNCNQGPVGPVMQQNFNSLLQLSCSGNVCLSVFVSLPVQQSLRAETGLCIEDQLQITKRRSAWVHMVVSCQTRRRFLSGTLVFVERMLKQTDKERKQNKTMEV